MLNYEECVNYMEGLSKFGSVYGLDTIRNFLNRLNFGGRHEVFNFRNEDCLL